MQTVSVVYKSSNAQNLFLTPLSYLVLPRYYLFYLSVNVFVQ